MTDDRPMPTVGSFAVIEAGRYCGDTGVIVEVSDSGRTLDVMTHGHGLVTVRRSSVELYDA